MAENYSPEGVSENQPNTEVKKHLAQELFESLKTVDHRRNKYDSSEPYNARSRETQVAQAECLMGLDESFLEECYGHLYSDFLAQERLFTQRTLQAALNHEPPPIKEPYDDLTVLEGFVNEVLVRRQIEIHKPELLSPETDPVKKKYLIELGDKILDIAHQPDRFGLDWYLGRNPDAAWLSMTSNDRIIIEGVGEITAGSLNKRKYLQLIGENGFEYSLKKLTHRLNSMNDAEKHGLGEFGVSGFLVDVSPRLKQYVVLRRGMDITPEGLSANIGPVVSDEEYSHLDRRDRKKVFSQTEHDQFLAQLTNKERTEVINAAFTNREVREIARVILKKIKSSHPSYSQT